MAVHSGADPFQLFGLPPRFELSLQDLDAAWKALQQAVHPDRFAQASDAERRAAMMASTRVNDAHRQLKDPVQRAAALLARNGHSYDFEASRRLPMALLEEQMALREAVEEARDLPADARSAALDAIRGQLDGLMAKPMAELTQVFDHDQPSADQLVLAETALAALQFFTKIRSEI